MPRPLPPLPVDGHGLFELQASGLTRQTIRAAGLYTVTEGDGVTLARLLNRQPEYRPTDVPAFCRSGGLVYPYRNLAGEVNCFARVKPRRPRQRKGKPVKYEQPVNSSPRAYYAPAVLPRLRGGKSPVHITEGEKKALALSQLGLAAVGLGGVYGWTSGGAGELIADLAVIPWAGRAVYIVFDHDPKPETRTYVGQAARKLARALRKAGAKEVYWVELPPGGGVKQGVDDFLAARGEGGPAEFMALVKGARPVPRPAALLANYAEREVKGDDGKAKTVRYGRTPAEVWGALSRLTGGWPRRVGGLLFAADGYKPRWLARTEDLFAWIGSCLAEPVRWAAGEDMVSQAVFHAYLRQTAECHEAVEMLPHYPPLRGHYYLHPEPAGGDGSTLNELLGRFCPATPTDFDLIHAAFLTPFWGGPAGARPAFLIESDGDDEGGRGTGKTTLAKAVAHLAGGHFDARPTEDYGRLVGRLLTPNALTRRVALLDNVKTLRFSWADLEGLITSDTINGHRLYAGDASRPNHLTWFLTLNHASLSKDLAQRCVIIHVKRPRYDAEWWAETEKFMDDNRWALVGDILAQLGGPKKELGKYSRWAAWEKGVLARVDDPAACQALIVERQAAVDGDQEEADTVRLAFAGMLTARGHNPDREVIFIPSAEAADVVKNATGENRSAQRATAYLLTLAIPELRKGNWTDGGRGWRWTGRESTGQAAVYLHTAVEALEAEAAAIQAVGKAPKQAAPPARPKARPRPRPKAKGGL
jgi:hypothetical protein